MKNIFAAFILGITFVGASFAQSSKPRIAVVEFKDSTGAMSYEAKRQLQASIAFALVKKRDFEVPDVRNTREVTPGPDVSPHAAVKIGKHMNVSYVLIGTVTEYSSKRHSRPQVTGQGTWGSMRGSANPWRTRCHCPIRCGSPGRS